MSIRGHVFHDFINKLFINLLLDCIVFIFLSKMLCRRTIIKSKVILLLFELK